jgi:phosphonopyruvate decarboxylase
MKRYYKTVVSSSQQKDLFEFVVSEKYDFFTGVPDSSLKTFINLVNESKISHVKATWEAEAIGIASGAFLSGKKPCVYLQNAGLGFALNPLTSLCIPYKIDLLLIVGHRHTLPQHKIMGEIDKSILDIIGWDNYIFVEK